jgi:hypothetical protein
MSENLSTFVGKSDIMVDIECQVIEEVILQELNTLKGMSSVDTEATIDKDCKPGVIGFRSQVLVSIMGQLEELLEIVIPNNCYIFRDTDGVRELTVKEASEKLKKIAKYAK